jgi:hypothetical protein
LGDIIAVATVSPTIDFGPEPVNQVTSPQTFIVANNANAGSQPANLAITSGDTTDFPVSKTTDMLGAQFLDVLSVTFHAPAAPGLVSTMISFSTGGDPFCSHIPPAIPVQGTATQAGITVSTNSLNFGNNNCGGAAAAALTVNVTNTGSQAFNVTGVSVDNTAYFTVAGGGMVTPMGAPVVITVTPNAIPGPGTLTNLGPVNVLKTAMGSFIASMDPTANNGQGTFGGTLTITTDATNDPTGPTRTVKLNMGAQGVIVTNDPITDNWLFPGPVVVSGTSSFQLPIKNGGNQNLQVTLTGLTAGVFTLASDPTVEMNAPSATQIVTNFSPLVPATTYNDNAHVVVTPVMGAAFCQPVPASWLAQMTLQGTSSP